MQENVILMTAAAQVTTGGWGRWNLMCGRSTIRYFFEY
ncbi:hypothetical protein E2C01_053369 [Portunus trituberculatus]|uniref:Uncharacterized protein n=1 Tax=Portunus trituberculatus TaxID=210409 RepID=A0A5B7GGE3_PORTR|nr:hypothetical protein [Portunus trituberculatus]